MKGREKQTKSLINKKTTLLSSSVRSAEKRKEKTGGEEEVNQVICLRGDINIYIFSVIYIVIL